MRDMPSNNSLNPTALSLPLMVVCWFNLACRLCRAAGEFQRYAASHVIAGGEKVG